MAFLIRVLEAGQSQLMEPMPADVGEPAIQHAEHCLRKARELAIQLRDRAIRGEPWWDLPMAIWEQLRRNTAPAAYLIERRGDAFLDTGRQVRARASETARGNQDPMPRAHPSDAIALADGGEEAEARTSTTATAFLLLAEQAAIAAQMLHAVEHVRQAIFGGIVAVHDETQTEDPADRALADPERPRRGEHSDKAWGRSPRLQPGKRFAWD